MEEEPVELSEEIDLSRDDLETDEEVESVASDSSDLLADEPGEDDEDDDDFNELEMLMDPYELNDY